MKRRLIVALVFLRAMRSSEYGFGRRFTARGSYPARPIAWAFNGSWNLFGFGTFLGLGTPGRISETPSQASRQSG